MNPINLELLKRFNRLEGDFHFLDIDYEGESPVSHLRLFEQSLRRSLPLPQGHLQRAGRQRFHAVYDISKEGRALLTTA